MKNLKGFAAIALVVACGISLVGCGPKGEDADVKADVEKNRAATANAPAQQAPSSAPQAGLAMPGNKGGKR